MNLQARNIQVRFNRFALELLDLLLEIELPPLIGPGGVPLSFPGLVADIGSSQRIGETGQREQEKTSLPTPLWTHRKYTSVPFQLLT